MENTAEWYWTATLVEEQLKKTRTSIQQTSHSIGQLVGVTTLETVKELKKQTSRREKESQQKLLEFEPVGIREQVEKVKKLLDMEGSSPSVAVILYGFGGVGKSTLAKLVIDTLELANYKFCRVLVDAEKPDKAAHIVQLQNDIIFDLSGHNLYLKDPEDGRRRLSEALETKSSFIFIDNIVEQNYVKELLPMKMLKEKQKMRILITSRTNVVRQELSIDSQCVKDYSLERLSDEAAIELLRAKIQGDCSSHTSSLPLDEDIEISAVAKACFGVPLLLDTYGRFLREERTRNALNSLQQGNFKSCTDIDLSKQVLYVYDKMEEDAKEAFLDICVFFYGEKWDLVASVVGNSILRKLTDRALVRKNERGEVSVHDVLRLMGRNNAKGTRLHSIEELSQVLEEGRKAITKVKGIWLLHNKSPFNFKCKNLEQMHDSLRVLALGESTTLDGVCRKAFRNLRFLQVGSIDIFPFENISDFGKLAVLHNGSIAGMRLPKLPPVLKQIKLTLLEEYYSSTTLPIMWKNIKSLTDLQKFELQNMSDKQVVFPEQFILPTCMVEVQLIRCKDLPKEFDRLTNLTKLTLKNCTTELITLPGEFSVNWKKSGRECKRRTTIHLWWRLQR
eukprot:Gb_33406 [translate_table: standard]